MLTYINANIYQQHCCIFYKMGLSSQQKKSQPYYRVFEKKTRK